MTAHEWYEQLAKPALTPPDWIFTPVWSVIYILIAIAISLYYQSSEKKMVRLTTAVLVVHLALNFAWMPLFFGLRSPLIGLIDVVAADITLVALVVLFAKTRPLAAALLTPYLLWIGFATYLNAAIYLIN